MKTSSYVGSLLFFYASFGPTFAQGKEYVPHTSLFFTSQETFAASREARKIAPAGKGDLHLGAIFYYGENDWTLWLQGERWTPDTLRENIKILHVTPTEVTFSWKEDAASLERDITLKPNQYYQIATEEIIVQP